MLVQIHLEAALFRQPVYDVQPPAEVMQRLGAVLDVNFQDMTEDRHLMEIESEISSATQRIGASAPFSVAHNADFLFGRLCHMVCRAIRPATIVETGVALGVTSAFVLKALHVNGQGMLHSIDLPPLAKGSGAFIGGLIPNDLKDRWRLYRGASTRILPGLLRKLGGIAVFIHDSTHTYWNIRRELRLAEAHLAPPGVVLVHDIEGNPAFKQWVMHAEPAFSAVTHKEGTEGLFGICVCRPGLRRP
jgi:hypothetical protein